MLKNKSVEELGEIIDTLDNIIAATSMSIPAELHIKAIKGSIDLIKEKLKSMYFANGGEDVWN